MTNQPDWEYSDELLNEMKEQLATLGCAASRSGWMSPGKFGNPQSTPLVDGEEPTIRPPFVDCQTGAPTGRYSMMRSTPGLQ